MPELPEVEHTRQNLDRWMRGARIVAVRTDDARIVRPQRPRAFVAALEGRTVGRIERRGKWLRLHAGDTSLFLHLGMTGWFEAASTEEPLRFERVRFGLERRGRRSWVVYVDARRWGRMQTSREELPSWQKLGPDPLADGIDAELLAARLGRRRSTIKEALMDQTVLAGVGNIQAIEALWRARIDPRSRASAVASARDVRAITAGLEWTITRTLADLAKGDAGAANPFRIYGRKGEPCPRCKTALVRTILGGRTTTYCPGCQVRRR